MASFEQSNARFPTTKWTLIQALAGPSESERAKAQNNLFATYWPPVYAYLRRRGVARESAAELAQAFFVEVGLGRELFDRADQSRGRLRSLITAALSRFVIDSRRRSQARGNACTLTASRIDEEEAFLVEAGECSAEQALDQRWAVGVLHEAVVRCRRHFEVGGKHAHWDLYEARVLRPAVTGIRPVPLADLAPRYGFSSPAAAAAVVQTVNKRLRALILEAAAGWGVTDLAGIDQFFA